MKLTIKVHHTEMVTPPRCRKPRPQEGKSEITVNIREVSAEAAPVAFIVSEYDQEPRKVRMYRGKLYRQVQDRQPQDREVNRRDENCPLWLNQAAEQCNWGWLLRPNYGRYNHVGKYWDYGTLATNKSKAAHTAENHIIVDGEAYERTGEPYYSVTCFGLGNNHGGTGFFVGWADYRDRKAIWGMTAADKHAAIEKGVEIALKRGDTESEEHIRQTPYDIQVFMPECIKRKYSKEY